MPLRLIYSPRPKKTLKLKVSCPTLLPALNFSGAMTRGRAREKKAYIREQRGRRAQQMNWAWGQWDMVLAMKRAAEEEAEREASVGVPGTPEVDERPEFVREYDAEEMACLYRRLEMAAAASAQARRDSGVEIKRE